MLLRLGRLLRTAGRDVLVLWHACRNPDTPRAVKLAAMLLAAYVLSPLDLMPDWLAVFGWVDDVTLLAFVVPALLSRLPLPVLEQARQAAGRWSFRRQRTVG